MMNRSGAIKQNDLPSGWRVVELGDVCERVVTGGTPLSSDKSFYENGHIPWLNTKEVNFCRIYFTKKNITQVGLEKSSAKYISKNCVIVAMYGATAGKVAINKIPLTTNQACCNLLVNAEEANYNFVYYYLSINHQKLLNLANGAAQQNLNTRLIKNLKITLPPLPEQKAIAHILGKLDDKIELNRQINQTLESMAQTLFKSWFVDFDPVIDNAIKAGNKIPKPLQHKADKRKTTKSTLPKDLQALFPDSFVFNDMLKKWIPDGWGVSILGETIKIKKGKNITKDNFIAGNIPVIAGGIKPAGLHNKYNARQPVITISASGANAGFVKLNLVNIWASDCSFISKDFEENIYYFYHWLNLRQKQIFDMQTGSAQPHIYPKDLDRLQIIAPNKNIIKTFERMGEAYYKKISLMNKETLTLTKLRDTLLPKLISGKIRVTEKI